MFSGCTSLESAPELPATRLFDSCYAEMFGGCTSLTKAPVLPAERLEMQCYSYMFRGCSKLEYVKCLATDIRESSGLYGWLEGVALSGTFVKVAGMNDWPRGDSGIPEGWTISEEL